jgi:hypothetical protein
MSKFLIDQFVELGVPLLFLLGFCGAGAVAIRFNLKTKKIVQAIDAAAAREGKNWSFWGNRRRQLRFLFNPSELIEAGDSQELRAAKEVLIFHRYSMWRTFGLGAAFLIGGALCAVAIPIFFALIER